jgi:hypothetical protein
VPCVHFVAAPLCALYDVGASPLLDSSSRSPSRCLLCAAWLFWQLTTAMVESRLRRPRQRRAGESRANPLLDPPPVPRWQRLANWRRVRPTRPRVVRSLRAWQIDLGRRACVILPIFGGVAVRLPLHHATPRLRKVLALGRRWLSHASSPSHHIT